jgi:RNA polymerase sigma factor (TIGR02999 family)
MNQPPENLTQILAAAGAGDPQAAEKLLPLVYQELRRLAASKMSHEKPGQTLQPTALVHEAWLRLGADHQPAWQNRVHFLAAAAEAMRRILIENARRKHRPKHGGDRERIELTDSVMEPLVEDEKLLQVHEALETLAVEDPQKAEVVKLRYFGGLTNEEIAAVLGVSEKTVRRHWELAKLKLLQNLKSRQ